MSLNFHFKVNFADTLARFLKNNLLEFVKIE